jgi:hypothetical protein
MVTSVWNTAVVRCNIPPDPLHPSQTIIIARLRRVPKKGGVIEVLKFELFDRSMIIHINRNYTTIPFRKLSENVMTDLDIPSGNHRRAVAFMISDLSMLSVMGQSTSYIHFSTTNTTVLPPVLRPYMRQESGPLTGSSASISDHRVQYVGALYSNSSFNALSQTEKDNLLSRILSSLAEDGWYLNCGGRRIPLLASVGSLRTLAEQSLLRHGRRRQQDEWHKLLHAQSDSSSGSESESDA